MNAEPCARKEKGGVVQPIATTVVWTTALMAYIFALLVAPSGLLIAPVAILLGLAYVAAVVYAPTAVAALLVVLCGAVGLAVSTAGVELGVRVYLLDPLVLGALAGTALRRFSGAAPAARWPFQLHFAVLIAYLTISAAHGALAGHELRAVLGDYRRMAMYPMILVVMGYAMRSWRDVRQIMRGVIAAGYVTTFIEARRILLGIGYNEDALAGQTIRYLSYLEATAAALAVLVLVGYARMRSGRAKFPLLAAAVPLIVTVLFSNYRTMWLALLVGLALQSLALGWRRGLKAIAGGLIVLAPIVYGLVEYSPLGTYVLDRFNLLNAAASGMWRYFSWLAAFKAWWAQPWFGTGLGYHHRFEYQNVESGHFLATTENTIHNDPLWFLVNNGIVGLAAFASLAVPVLRLALRQSDSDSAQDRFRGSTAVGALGLMLVVSMLQPFFSVGATTVVTSAFVMLVVHRSTSVEQSL